MLLGMPGWDQLFRLLMLYMLFNGSQPAALQALKDGKRLLKEGSAAAAMVRFEKALMLAKVRGGRLLATWAGTASWLAVVVEACCCALPPQCVGKQRRSVRAAPLVPWRAAAA